MVAGKATFARMLASQVDDFPTDHRGGQKAMVSLQTKLKATRWSWPDRKLTRPWFLFDSDGTVVPGWHPQAGKWVVVAPNTVRAVIMSNPRTLQTYLVDLDKGTLKNARTGEMHYRLP